MKHALVTGAAGFIGSHLVDQLLAEGWQVTAVDNFDPFYDAAIKEANIKPQLDFVNYRLVRLDIRDFDGLSQKLSGEYDLLLHLAAKAGVRPSIKDPQTYQEVNVTGTQNLLELARQRGIKQFIFASSSSVYGVNPNLPWKETDHVLLPISPYASTKVSGELMGHVYSQLYGMRFIALRFFTVYGPRQRPDLAIRKFAHLMQQGQAIPVFGNGSTSRDYTFITDIISGIRSALDYQASNYEVINLGNNRTVGLNDLIQMLEEVFGIKAEIQRLPEEPGDLPQTWADLTKARSLLGYDPQIDIKEGLVRFARWFEANN